MAMAMGGEAALQAGKALKANILDLAASVLQTTADIDARRMAKYAMLTREARMDLAEVVRPVTSDRIRCHPAPSRN